jgi:hypothetical protein
MDARITELEARVHRLRTDVEDLKTALWRLEFRKQMDWFRRYCLALIVLTIALFVALWRSLGWI